MAGVILQSHVCINLCADAKFIFVVVTISGDQQG